MVTPEAVRGRPVVIADAQHEQRAVPQEYELAARSKEPSRLRNPCFGIRPDGRPELADDEVKRAASEGHLLACRLTNGKTGPTRSESAGDGQLPRCGIDSDRSGTATGQPC